jgi:predicted Ser/Thr protein kinase/nitrous oxidase accessory protein NosD
MHDSLEPYLDLLNAVRSSGLVRADRLDGIPSELKASGVRTPGEATSCLVEKGVLTAYQGEELLAGRLDACVLANRYHLLDRIGEGGMGAVYRARDTKLDRVVAVKVLPPDRLQDPAAVARFQREARALAKLSHSGIVQAYDADEDRGRQFLAMEYVEGTNLRDLILEHGPLSPARAADVIHQAARALEHAHSRGLVHRDLKPSNLLVTRTGQVKLLDLGLARFVQDQIADVRLTLEGMGMGTPDYMAPEQFRGARNADERSDVYGLGCTLHEALSGRVPFPGSSLEEKIRAHEEAEPAPIEELCPECPTGLALAARKMMAKRPADRFQSAREAAEALAPYVAGSSVSAAAIRAQSSFRGSQLAIVLPERSRRRRTALGAAAVGTIAIGLTWLAIAAPWRREPASRQTGPGSQAERLEPAQGTTADGAILIVAAEGSGEFRTIGEALAAVKPGATIRVRPGVYREELQITRTSSQAGIQLVGERGAVIDPLAESVGPSAAAIRVANVPRVLLRGLRIISRRAGSAAVVVAGRCPGVRLQELEVEGGQAGIAVQAELNDDESPVIIESCTALGSSNGILCTAMIGNDATTSLVCRRVLIRNNRIEGCGIGIQALGRVREVQISGNRVSGARLAGIQLALLGAGPADILVANNSVLESEAAFRVWDGEIQSDRVEVVANLLCGRGDGGDVHYLDSGSTVMELRGPGDGARVLERWSFRRNWREGREPRGESFAAKSWVRPAASDVLVESIPLLSRDPASADFLRPGESSPLAKAGAGSDDPTLPAHVGAMAPAGAEAWDWEKTWSQRHPKKVITVSKEPQAGGDCRSINEALRQALPGTTVRIIDGADYEEAIRIQRGDLHAGLTIEAPGGATLVATSTELPALTVQHIARVTLRGLRFRSRNRCYLVTVIGRSPGIVLENLQFETEGATGNIPISLEALDLAPDEPPVTVRGCTMRRAETAIRVSGIHDDYRTPLSCGRVLIHGCLIEDSSRGILLIGGAHDILVAGNRIFGASLAAIQLENLVGDAGRILIANNTVVFSAHALRLWDGSIKGKEIAIRNNLFLESVVADVVFIDSGGTPGTIRGAGDGRALLAAWTWGGNWRVGAPPSKDPVLESSWVPGAPGDTLAPALEGFSQNPRDPGYLRPRMDSPIAGPGPGPADPGLPAHAGALAPEGVEPWDWTKTWEGRFGGK